MEICGYQMGCKEEATVTVKSDTGGYFGRICDGHADHFNRYLESMMTVNKTLYEGGRVASDNIPRYVTMGRAR